MRPSDGEKGRWGDGGQAAQNNSRESRTAAWVEIRQGSGSAPAAMWRSSEDAPCTVLFIIKNSLCSRGNTSSEFCHGGAYHG